MRNRIVGPVSALLLLATATAASASDGAALYAAHCAGCHGDKGEGGGDASALVGNEAVRDAARLRQLVQQGQGDMPACPPMGEADLSALIDFVQTFLGGPGSGPTPAAPPYMPGDAGRGLAYFTGRSPLSAGGAACSGCHAAGPQTGGALGRDLASTATRYAGESAIAKALARPAFPVMRATYASQALTDREAADLAAFLVSVGKSEPSARPSSNWIWLAGGAGTVVLFILAGVAGSGRGESPAQRLRRSGRQGRRV